MNKLNRVQKDKIRQFMSVSDASEKVALTCLKAAEWSLEGAFDLYFNSPTMARSSVDGRKIDALYQRYKDPSSDMILVDGISQFCEDLQVDPSDVVMLVISFKMHAETMCEFTREEFASGMAAMGVDSIERLREQLPSLRAELNNEAKFREVYLYAFHFSREKGQKSLALETAVAMWKLLFSIRPWPLVDAWCDFLTTAHNKAISRDTWSQLFDFSRQVDPTLATYDSEGAWPYLIDEFVEWQRKKQQAA